MSEVFSICWDSKDLPSKKLCSSQPRFSAGKPGPSMHYSGSCMNRGLPDQGLGAAPSCSCRPGPAKGKNNPPKHPFLPHFSLTQQSLKHTGSLVLVIPRAWIGPFTFSSHRTLTPRLQEPLFAETRWLLRVSIVRYGPLPGVPRAWRFLVLPCLQTAEHA